MLVMQRFMGDVVYSVGLPVAAGTAGAAAAGTGGSDAAAAGGSAAAA